MKPILTACLAAALAAAGCARTTGPRTMHVWGHVTYEGKPVEEGTITFDSTDGSSPAQGAIKAGQFDIPAETGPMAEKSYTIRISAMAKTGKTIPNVMGDGAPTMEVLAETIPPAFNEKSTLSRTISADPAKNQLDFTLHKSGSSE